MGLLSGKVSIVSGSSRGIGQSIAANLLRKGAIVYLTGRDEKRLKRVYKQYQNEYGDAVRSYCGDLTDTKILKDLITTVMDQDTRLDISIANIGSGRSKQGWDIDDIFWQESMENNFFSSVKLSRESLKVMIPQHSGNIIFISSIAGCEVINAPVPYATAKSALLTYMKYTANLVAPEGIRMNAISPGNIFFEGGTWSNKLKENPEVVNAYIHDNVPMQKFGAPEDIAHLACYLASDYSSFITGANFILDGGQTRRL